MKFSIVTPAYNSERYIRETIESVIRQKGAFSIEYIVLDNQSTDRTCDIAKEYQQQLTAGTTAIHCHDVQLHLYSERDVGMYDAIKKGFARATGEVHAWVNSDDMYLPGAFDVVQRTLSKYPQIAWLKGITSYINEHSTVYAAGQCNLYRQDFIEAGLYGPVLRFIQQDSVFWRATLWQESGGVDETLSLSGDYFLWKAFSKVTPLYSLNAHVSCFRKRTNQKSSDTEAYFREIESISKVDPHLSRRIRRRMSCIERLPRPLRPLCYRVAFGQHKHHLVLLENGTVPTLVEDEYFALKNML